MIRREPAIAAPRRHRAPAALAAPKVFDAIPTTRKVVSHLNQAPRVMHRWNVMVAALQGHEASAEDIGRRLRCAWESRIALTIESAPIEQLSGVDLSKFDAIILAGDANASHSAT